MEAGRTRDPAGVAAEGKSGCLAPPCGSEGKARRTAQMLDRTLLSCFPHVSSSVSADPLDPGSCSSTALISILTPANATFLVY